MPRIHPKLDHLLTAFKTALDPISPDYWKEYAMLSFKDWAGCGKPVLEEEVPREVMEVLNKGGHLCTDLHEKHIRNDALEEAARSLEIKKCPRAAALVRKLKTS